MAQEVCNHPKVDEAGHCPDCNVWLTMSWSEMTDFFKDDEVIEQCDLGDTTCEACQ